MVPFLRVSVLLCVFRISGADDPDIFESFDVSDSENEAIMENSTDIFKNSYLTGHPSWSIITSDGDIDCGESSSDRIIGGVDANLGQFPWIARLGYISRIVKRNVIFVDIFIYMETINRGLKLCHHRNSDLATSNKNIEYRCGGSLISDQYVVTAAHCLKTTGVRLIRVRLGDFDSSKEINCVNGVCAEKPQEFKISQIMWHRKFNDPPMSNDIGLIRLNGKADYNGWVLPICLPTESLGTDPKGTAEVAGWGITDMFTNERATVLQTVSIPLLPISECQKTYAKKAVIRDNQICAGGNEDQDSCGGDSGGPLMKIYDGESFPQYYLVGVVSFGPATCGSEVPAVYTSVYNHMKWILNNIKP